MSQQPIFTYDSTATEYLKEKDRRLGAVIDQVGPISRPIIPDLYTALVNAVVGQQISSKAHATIWSRITDQLEAITPEHIERLSLEELQRFGISIRKAVYIKDMTHQIYTGAFDLEALYTLPDEEVIRRLSSLRGIGLWTAEMLMLFSMQRPNILSYGDLAIIRGMKMVYHHREISKERFERYRRRLSPWGSVASLYFWHVASGEQELDL